MRPWTRFMAPVFVVIVVAGCGSDPAAPTETHSSTSSTTSATSSAPEESTTTARALEPVWFGDYFGVGDCWTEIRDAEGEADRTGEPEIVDCDEIHDQQVTGIVAIDSEEFPGEDALRDLANEECTPDHKTFTGVDFGEGNLSGFVVLPDEADWDAGAREIICVAYFRFGPVSMSLEDVGHDTRPAGFPLDAPLPENVRLFNASENEDGDMVVGFSLEARMEDALQTIRTRAAEAGWDITNESSASNTVVFELTDGESDYTLTVSSLDEEDPTDLSLAFFYDPPTP